MFDGKNDTVESLTKLGQLAMLENLIEQLNKDFSLTGLDIHISVNLGPKLLIERLNEIVAALMKNEFHKFINFLYRVDIPEEKIGELQSLDFDQLVNAMTFLILKKEWQKVWFRNRNLLQE